MSGQGTSGTTRDNHHRHHRHHDNHGQHEHHRRRRTHNFPPQEYNDLTRTDITLLAPILLPQTAKESRSEYEKAIKKRIADLPAHLQCKHPLMSSFCSLHSKISPLPIVSLFTSFREEVEDGITRTWLPLVESKQLSAQKAEIVEIVQQLAVLWLGPSAFTQRYGKEPRRALAKIKLSKCAACTLAMMAADFQTQVSMAGLFIGKVNQGIWDSSKRIMWFLEWTAARMPESRREESKRLIWEIGKKFRLTRIGAEEAKSKKGKSRINAVEETEEGPGTGIYLHPFNIGSHEDQEKSDEPRKMINSTAQEEIDLEELERRRDSHEPTIAPEQNKYPRASSIYSRTTSGLTPQQHSIAKEIESILALYEESDGISDRFHQHDDDGNTSGYSVGNPFASEIEAGRQPEAEASRESRPAKNRLGDMISKGLRNW